MFLSVFKALEVANANALSDPNWIYTVIVLGNGKTVIEVTDEDGYIVGKL